MMHGKQQATLSVEQIDKAGESLNAITGSVAAIAEKNVQIAKTGEEHRAVSRDINNSVREISTMADQTASETRDMTASSKHLAETAEELQQMLRQFRIQ